MPSGRTVTSPDMSVSRQNSTPSTSSGPMTYSGGAAATGAGGCAGVFAVVPGFV